MLNKKIKIIIIGILVIILTVVLIFSFGLKRKDKNSRDDDASSGKIIEDRKKDKEIEDILSEDENILNILAELKSNHPEFSDSQLEFYRETAKKNKEILVPCEGRNDENDCVVSVAFLKGRIDICSHIENKGAKIECANAILREGNSGKIDKCRLLGGDDFIKCSRDLFLIYDKPENCLNLKSEKARQMCESVFYYETAFIQRDMELCKKITDEKLNQYCFKNIIGKFLDSDNDGLTDYEEIFIYKTNPNKKDTDGDGYSDGDEVKNGYNPLGEGKMK